MDLRQCTLAVRLTSGVRRALVRPRGLSRERRFTTRAKGIDRFATKEREMADDAPPNEGTSVEPEEYVDNEDDARVLDPIGSMSGVLKSAWARADPIDPVLLAIL